MAIDHQARARKAWPILVRAASTRSPMTYAELGSKIGVHYRAAQYLLGVIQVYCAKNKLPPLQALAVNRQTGLPGSGYYGSGRTHAAHQRALDDVCRKKWPATAPF